MLHDLPNPAAIVTLIIGVILWLLGGKLLRIGACLTGLALAVILCMLFLPQPLDPVISLVAVALASVVGLALGWVLFRLWMGLSLGVVLAIAVPMTVLAFDGVRGPEDLIPPSPGMRQPVRLHNNAPHPSPLPAPRYRERGFVHLAALSPEQQTQVEELDRAAKERLQPALTTTSDWWHSLPPAERRRAERYGLIAGVAGVIFGLLFPVVSAALQTSLLGSVLIVASAISLAPDFYPEAVPHLPHDGKSFLAITFMLAVIGFIFQWTISRPKADKEPKPDAQP